MSTLAEIEAAADALPLEQKKKLLEFLASLVHGEYGSKRASDLAQFAGVLRLPEDPLASQQRAASGNDRAARHERRALSSRRPVGRATSRWKLRRVGDHGNGGARVAVAHDRRRKESPRIPRAGCDLRIDSIDSWASRAAQERATSKAAGCCRVRDRDGIWRRALDE